MVTNKQRAIWTYNRLQERRKQKERQIKDAYIQHIVKNANRICKRTGNWFIGNN